MRSFSLFPNPATDVIIIDLKEELIGSNFVITDNAGRIIKTGQINYASTQIDILDLSPGIYVLAINGKSEQKCKLIKQ